jgi:uncharacterized protein YtpQ (UPF0354 family)
MVLTVRPRVDPSRPARLLTAACLYVHMAEQLRLAPSEPPDATLIVPVLKRQAPPSDNVVVLPPELELMSDVLIDDLNIFYAFDFPAHFVYVSAGDCKTLEIAPGALRELSVRNLTKRRTKPEILRPSDAAVMLRLDGDIEASLLLVDHLWPQLARGLAGETVVAVPSRDVLVASGTQVTGGIETLRHAVNRRWDNPDARNQLLTRSLLVRRHNSWQVFEP